ncbi:MAG: glycosyltransferase family 4 protein [Candidatus Omnitrophota bacterium]
MKIGFFYPEYYPVSASASVHGYQLARGLIDRGHKLLTCTDDRNPDCIQYPSTKLGCLTLMQDADILYIRLMSYFEHAVMWKFAKPFRLPVVWEINAPLEEQLVFATDSTKADLVEEIKAQNRKRRFYSCFVDGAICVSEEMRKYARNFLKIKNSYCVPNGSDPKLFNPNNSVQQRPETWKNKFIVLWAGNPALPQQAIQLMQTVARKIQDADRDIIFVFISSEPEFEFSQEENIAVLSEVNYLSMPSYINNADLCLCLYNSYEWSKYGCYISPLKLFDYMSCAKPVIASDMGQISTVIEDNVNGLLTDNKVDDIVAKILECKENPRKAESLGKQARKTVTDYYNWDRVVQQTEDVLLSRIRKK